MKSSHLLLTTRLQAFFNELTGHIKGMSTVPKNDSAVEGLVDTERGIKPWTDIGWLPSRVYIQRATFRWALAASLLLNRNLLTGIGLSSLLMDIEHTCLFLLRFPEDIAQSSLSGTVNGHYAQARGRAASMKVSGTLLTPEQAPGVS